MNIRVQSTDQNQEAWNKDAFTIQEAEMKYFAQVLGFEHNTCLKVDSRI